LGHLGRLHLVPILNAIGVPWRGWHAFRRGLATNLSRLGIAPKVIQAILRHSKLDITMNIYVQPVAEDSIQAMSKLEQALMFNPIASVQ
jgi:integrase